MSPPINLDSKRNADWLAGASHGRKAQAEIIGQAHGTVLIELYTRLFGRDGPAEQKLLALMADLGIEPPDLQPRARTQAPPWLTSVDPWKPPKPG